MHKLLLTFFIISILGLSSLYAAFKIETVDTIPHVYGEASHGSAVDTNGALHIVYGLNDLYYATNKSGSWIIEKLNSSRSQGESDIDLVLDSNNNVHVSYYDDGLKYTTNKSGSWIIEIIYDDIHFGVHSSIAIDSNNIVHIGFISMPYCIMWCDLHPDNLLYTTNKSASWVSEIIIASRGWFPTIAVDSNDNVHIGYYATNDDLKYITNKSGSWISEIVDSAGVVGIYASIVVDSSDKVSISYHDSTNRNLKFATNHSGSWMTETIDNNGEIGLYTALALDNNKAYISYYDMGNRDLKYISNRSGNWVNEVVDSSGSVGEYTSISLDNFGKIHISYYDATNETLKYAVSNTSISVPLFSPLGVLLLMGLFGLIAVRKIKPPST